MATSSGDWIKRALVEVQNYIRLIGAVGQGLVTRPFYLRDVVEQFDLIGIGSLTVVLLTGTFTGMVLALQSGHTLDQFGARSVVGRLVSASMVRELGPVLTALMVTGRVGSGIAAELGSMVVTEQIAALRALGTDPVRKLVIPRTLAGTLMLPILTVMSDAIGMVGAAVIAQTQLRIASSVYWNNVVQGLYVQDVWMGLIKPVVLGFALVTIACHVGLGTTGGTQGVGRSTTRAVVAGSVAVLALDFLVTKLLMALMDRADSMPATLPSLVPSAAPAIPPVVTFDHVSLSFDEKVVLRDVSFDLQPGDLIVFLGASGAGKSTILRLILGLLRPDDGRILINGERTDGMTEAQLMHVRADVGMVFQEGALFDSLTVRENAGYRLFEETREPIPVVDTRVAEVLGFVGLGEFGARMPSELSGGQRRRVAIARAVASRPRLVLYDEPTTGLDPITALSIDAEIVKLRDLERVTSIVVTHQLRDAFYIATHTATRGADGRVQVAPAAPDAQPQTRFVMLKDGFILFEGPAAALRETRDVYLREFLS